MISRYDKFGRYLSVGSKTVLRSILVNPPPSPGDDGALGEYEGAVNMASQYHDLATNLPVDMPPRPSEFHEFDYTRKQWVANPEAAWASVKQKRARLLAGSDWMVTKAAESGQTVPPEWVAYRQALRDITLQADPWAIVWPVAP